MGQVITLYNSEGPPPSVLTETGSGGLLSAGSLRDRPAASYLDEGERAMFAVTNRKRGIEVERDGETKRFRPGSSYRTIAVVTDRRILVLVGDSDADGVDGDQRLVIPLSEVEVVTVERGRPDALALTRCGGSVWRLYAGGTLDGVVDYLEAATQAWVHLENTLDDVRRSLVTATGHRDDGEYEAALAAVETARDRLSDARRTATAFDADWPAAAMHERVERVEERCLSTLADARVGRARTLADEAEAYWREERYELAHETFQLAREQYRVVRSLDDAAVDGDDRVRAELERLDRTIEQLEKAPLRTAIEAHREAEAADDPGDAADAWERALEYYRTAMELDWGEEEPRFAGDPAAIKAELGTVVERLTAARRSAGRDAKRAGEWHVGAGKEDLAREEFETACEQFERALAVAEDLYPDAVDHLEADLAAAEQCLERLDADGDEAEAAEEPSLDVEATIGVDDGDAEDEDEDDTDRPAATDGGRRRGGAADLAERIRRLEEDGFVTLVASVLEVTGWDAEHCDGDPRLLATKRAPSETRMPVHVVHRPSGEPVGPAAVEECHDLRRSVASADGAMLATSASLSTAGTRSARERGVRLLDDECLTAVVESRDMADDLLPGTVSVEE